MVSRRQTREFLLQALYAQGEGKEYDRDMFIEAYFSDEEYQLHLDTIYLDRMEKEIHDHEGELLVLVSRLAPKFELSTMPLLHILILMIALSELLYVADLDIPEPVSVNEAIELAKKFSDEQGKSFVNGALSTFLKHRSDFLDLSSENLSFRVF